MTKKQRGFTLIEILVTVVLTGLVVSIVMGLYARMSRSYDALSAVGDAQQNLRAVRSMVAREIRASGGNPAGLLMAGGRIWFPGGAKCTVAAGSPPELGCEFWLGFNFKDNWSTGGVDTLSDAIFVSYAGRPQTGVDFSPMRIATLDPDPQFDGAVMEAALPAELEVGDFAMLTNGYHACVVEITAFDGATKRVDWAAGTAVNPANGLSDYCLPFQTSGPGAGTNTPGLLGGTYCGLGEGPPDRRCYLLDMQTVRLRRFYIWPETGGAGDRELRLETAVGAERVVGAGATLLLAGPATGITREVLVRGMEDMQVSYQLRGDNGSTPGVSFPNPPLTAGQTGYQAAGTAFEYHTTKTGTCTDHCAASCAANTSDCRGECVPVGVDDATCFANPDSPQDEARWLDQITVTLLARTRSRVTGTLGGTAGLQDLNGAWGSNQPSQASSFLRRSLRVEVDMRNYMRNW